MEDAEKLLNILKEVGLKHSGIISLKNITIEIRGNEKLETPIVNCSKEFLETIVEDANEKLKRAKENLMKLEKAISSL